MKIGGPALLADTHVWIWYVADEHRHASRAAWAELLAAAQRQAVGISDISLWEIALKSRKPDFDLHLDPHEWFAMARQRSGFGVIEVDRKVLVDSAMLDWKHRDPADRILVTTAQRYNMRLATADDAILNYAATGKLKVLDMRTEQKAR